MESNAEPEDRGHVDRESLTDALRAIQENPPDLRGEQFLLADPDESLVHVVEFGSEELFRHVGTVPASVPGDEDGHGGGAEQHG